MAPNETRVRRHHYYSVKGRGEAVKPNGKSGVTRRRVVAGMAAAGTLGKFRWAHGISTTENPVASTSYGQVRGVARGGVLSFRGIPYGGPTEGPNRFMPPKKPSSWTEVRDATEAAPRAMQEKTGSMFEIPLLGDYFGGGRKDAAELTREFNSENCLVLNVLTPALSGLRPVLIYIHGGGFDKLSSALTLVSDRFVAEQDVVLVGVNHRLNVFGYTYLGGIDPIYADSGNVGQLDLIAALGWVRDNIANFGGDPSNVTLFGESGGGAKISTLLAMPDAKGLFHRAIIESGSYLLKVRSREAAEEDTNKLLSALGISTDRLSDLQTLSAEKLLAAYTSLPTPLGGQGPVVDGRSLPHQTWRPDAPPEAVGVSLIIGCCKDETTLDNMSDASVFALDWRLLKEKVVKSGIPEDKVDSLIHLYRRDYLNESPSDIYFRIGTDKYFRRNAIAQAEAKVRQGHGDVYMYYFAWDTPLADGKLRAFHTAELPLAMRLVSNPQSEGLSKQIAGAWAAFARSGDPNHAGLPHWQTYSLEKRATMVFDAGNTKLVMKPAREELSMLLSLPEGNENT